MQTVVAQIADGLFWLSITLFAVLGVAATVAYNFIGKVRELVEAEKQSQQLTYEAELARITASIRQNRSLDGSTLTEAGQVLQKKEARLRREIAELDGLSSVMDIGKTLLVPASFLFLAFTASNIAKLINFPWSIIVEIVSFALIAGAAGMAARSFLRTNRLNSLLLPQVHTDIVCRTAWRTGVPNRISITTMLQRGSCLHSLQVLLYLPPCFRSTAAFNAKLRRPQNDPLMPSYNTIPSKEWLSLKRDVPYSYDYDRLSCRDVGTHKCFYRVVSEEYTSAIQEFSIEIQG